MRWPSPPRFIKNVPELRNQSCGVPGEAMHGPSLPNRAYGILRRWTSGLQGVGIASTTFDCQAVANLAITLLAAGKIAVPDVVFQNVPPRKNWKASSIALASRSDDTSPLLTWRHRVSTSASAGMLFQRAVST